MYIITDHYLDANHNNLNDHGRCFCIITDHYLDANHNLIAQDYDQIKEVYHETGLNELISTTAYKVIFTQK